MSFVQYCLIFIKKLIIRNNNIGQGFIFNHHFRKKLTVVGERTWEHFHH